jgi:uncharacterized iron-regulated protein
VFNDLAKAGAVFVGEAHTIQRHHAVQLRVLQELFARGVPLALCLEQLEARDQPAVDRYNRREIDFEALAAEINWKKKWANYPDYRALCEFARDHRIPIRALNAPAEIIRAVSRGGGLAKLPAEQRAQLPADIGLDDPAYERLTTLELAVHMALDPQNCGRSTKPRSRVTRRWPPTSPSPATPVPRPIGRAPPSSLSARATCGLAWAPPSASGAARPESSSAS